MDQGLGLLVAYRRINRYSHARACGSSNFAHFRFLLIWPLEMASFVRGEEDPHSRDSIGRKREEEGLVKNSGN
ncbi:hypothetical protein BaRGS_00003910 [Batillaria attramentaria]|uniref:Uncharacterized protein n=1 Tax=Batillaria attramentaria TaxID=370345 RepID=A0ABD0M0X3_9CAEN